jgi:hypothetical protein
MCQDPYRLSVRDHSAWSARGRAPADNNGRIGCIDRAGRELEGERRKKMEFLKLAERERLPKSRERQGAV